MKLVKLQRTRADTEAKIPSRLERELWFIDNWNKRPPWEKRQLYKEGQQVFWCRPRREVFFKKEQVDAELAYKDFVFPEDVS